jgi:T-complex protein 1 subunit alpha
VIPKTLSVNAAQDATELVAALRAEHFKMQHDDKPDPQLKFAGLDLVGGVVRDNLKFGVVRSTQEMKERKEMEERQSER